MAKRDLKTEYIYSLIGNSAGHKGTLASREGVLEEKGLNRTLSLLKQTGASGDVDLIVDIERVSLEYRLNTLNFSTAPDRDRQEKSSLKAGIQRTEEAVEALKGVRKGSAYKTRLLTTTRKELDKDGLPKDSFRTFVTGQIASINNQLRSSIDPTKKDILEQRIENLRTAETLYKGLQRQALSRAEPKPMAHKPNERCETLGDFIQSLSPSNRATVARMLSERAASRNEIIPDDIAAKLKGPEKGKIQTTIPAPKKPGDGERSR